MTSKRSHLHNLAQVLPESIYLAGMRAVIRSLSKASLNNQWQRYTKRRLGTERSPMWAAELYQLIALLVGLALVAGLPEPRRVPRFVSVSLGVIALYRLFEVMLFALHWVFVDRRPVKDFRRSLLAFGLSLIELSVFATIALFWWIGGFGGSRWDLLYAVSATVFSQSLPAIDGKAARLLLHAVIVEAWVLLLVVIAVAVSGITRGEMDDGEPSA